MEMMEDYKERELLESRLSCSTILVADLSLCRCLRLRCELNWIDQSDDYLVDFWEGKASLYGY